MAEENCCDSFVHFFEAFFEGRGLRYCVLNGPVYLRGLPLFVQCGNFAFGIRNPLPEAASFVVDGSHRYAGKKRRCIMTYGFPERRYFPMGYDFSCFTFCLPVRAFAESKIINAEERSETAY